MGRRRVGPVRIGTSTTWYARLTVPPKLRAQTGKTRLIRSLQTSDHSTALRRYAQVYAALEAELEALVRGNPLQVRVDLSRVQDSSEMWLSPYEASVQALNVPNLQEGNIQHEEVYKALDTGLSLPITWNELITLWQEERSLSKARPLAANTVTNMTQAVKTIDHLFTPSSLTKDAVKYWIADQRKKVADSTVVVRFRALSTLVNVGINEEKLFFTNPFNKVKFTASKSPSEGKRPLTMEELFLVKKELPAVFLMSLTSLRPSELASRGPDDLKDGILLVNDQPSIDWRPKTPSSYRRVPFPLTDYSWHLDHSSSNCMIRTVKSWRTQFNKLIPDKRATPHSGRHTFITLSRMADCDPRVIQCVTGHAKGEGSQVMQGYGEFKDEVLTRECKKIWEYVEGMTS